MKIAIKISIIRLYVDKNARMFIILRRRDTLIPKVKAIKLKGELL